MTKILSTNGLCKSYGSKQVLNNLSISVDKGTIYGILGPNGSGKTTTLGILLDVIPAQSGSFTWFDEAPSHLSRKRIGALLETPNFFDYLSAERNLRIVADIKDVPYSDIDRVLKFVHLQDRKDDKFKTFSLGMKQRLAIASTLLGNPEALILDEPTNGLDPQGISDIRELILSIAEKGITIIIASHMLDEVEKICTDVAIIKNGDLLVQGKVDEILGDENLVALKADDMDALEAALKKHGSVVNIKKKLGLFVVKISDQTTNGELNKFLHGEGVVLTHLVSRKKNLEMQFLEITNKK